MIFVFATTPAPVDAPDLRGGGIGESGKSIFSGAIQAGHQRLVLGNFSVRPGQEAVGGLQVKALALAVFVVDGDALDRDGFNGFNAVETAHPVEVGEERTAVFAQVVVWFGAVFAAHVGVAALAADAAGHGGKLAVARDMVCRAHVELGAHHAVHAALVVNEAARPEFRQRQKARAADHAAFVVLAFGGCAALGGYPGHEWQAREVVARQKALAGQVAVGVEIRVLAVARLEQHRILAGGVAIAALGVLLFGVAGGVAFDHLVGHVHLLAGGVHQHAPALEGGAEVVGGASHGGIDLLGGKPAAASKHGGELGHETLGAVQGACGDFGGGEFVAQCRLQGLVGLLQV